MCMAVVTMIVVWIATPVTAAAGHVINLATATVCHIVVTTAVTHVAATATRFIADTHRRGPTTTQIVA